MRTSTNQFNDAARVWDERFDTPEFQFGTEPNSYLARQARWLKPGQRALAVADGEGRNSVWMARQGRLVDAFDISAVGVAKARQLARHAGRSALIGMVASKSAHPWGGPALASA